MTHAHIYYSGTVQGVGFRYTVQGYATALGLKGWVQNLSDGRVEIRVEGAKATIELLSQKIDEHFDGFIRDKQITFSDELQNYIDFKVKR